MCDCRSQDTPPPSVKEGNEEAGTDSGEEKERSSEEAHRTAKTEGSGGVSRKKRRHSDRKWRKAERGVKEGKWQRRKEGTRSKKDGGKQGGSRR